MCTNKFAVFVDIMIKPDGVQRRKVGDIISRFEEKGFHLRALKLTTPSKDVLAEHYQDLASKPFFPKLMAYMTSGPVVAMVSPYTLLPRSRDRIISYNPFVIFVELGVGRKICCKDRQSYAWRYKSSGVIARHDSRRLRH